jgi:hypothetical protein
MEKTIAYQSRALDASMGLHPVDNNIEFDNLLILQLQAALEFIIQLVIGMFPESKTLLPCFLPVGTKGCVVWMKIFPAGMFRMEQPLSQCLIIVLN